jgi:hypothetical protein
MALADFDGQVASHSKLVEWNLTPGEKLLAIHVIHAATL